MNWYIKCLKQYVDFSGRARRKEYWMFVLFNFVFSFVLGLLDTAFGWNSELGLGILGGIYSLCVFLPGLAVVVRRLHDVGKSGWFFLIILIPIVGAIWLIVLFCLDGQPGDNKYGPNPKELPDYIL